MSTTLDTRRETAYAPLTSRAALVTEALTCMLSGRALPASLRAPAPACLRPATVEAGLAQLLAGPAPMIQ